MIENSLMVDLSPTLPAHILPSSHHSARLGSGQHIMQSPALSEWPLCWTSDGTTDAQYSFSQSRDTFCLNVEAF